MNVPTDQFAALTEHVAALTRRVGQLEEDAFMLRTLEQMFFEQSRWSPPRDSQTGRVRHLRPVGGGQP